MEENESIIKSKIGLREDQWQRLQVMANDLLLSTRAQRSVSAVVRGILDLYFDGKLEKDKAKPKKTTKKRK